MVATLALEEVEPEHHECRQEPGSDAAQALLISAFAESHQVRATKIALGESLGKDVPAENWKATLELKQQQRTSRVATSSSVDPDIDSEPNQLVLIAGQAVPTKTLETMQWVGRLTDQQKSNLAKEVLQPLGQYTLDTLRKHS